MKLDKSQKIFIIFHGRFPSEKAASLFVAKDCESFAEQGVEVELVVPNRKGRIEEDAFQYYGIKNNFTTTYTGTIDLFTIPFFKYFAFWMSYISFTFSSTLYILRHKKEGDIVYSNEILNLFVLSLFCKNTFYEMHDFPESKLWIFSLFLKRMKWILVHNKWKLEEIRRIFPGISTETMLYQPNAVDIEKMNIRDTQREARLKLGLPIDNRLIIYTGHLYGWKGVDTLAQAASQLPGDYSVVCVGGTESDVVSMKEKYTNVPNLSFVGHKKHSLIPLWQRSADVLVIPNTAKDKISKYYTSPMKLFEYMASKTLIVASDIPSIREIVGESEVVFSKPDDSDDLAESLISAVTMSEDEKNSKIDNAYKKVLEYTWKNRAENILNYINKYYTK